MLRTDWLPAARELQLAMAKKWCAVLAEWWQAWDVLRAEADELQRLANEAAACLARAEAPDRNAVDTARCRTAFAALVRCMRGIKNRRFHGPPLSAADFAALGLHTHARAGTHVGAPVGQATADISYPGVSRLRLHLYGVDGGPHDTRADYGYRIYYGVLPAGGASVEEATGHGRYLLRAAILGEDLPHSIFTRRRRIIMDFPQEDSGKRVYFCIRYENAKGEHGPWGPMVSAVVP